MGDEAQGEVRKLYQQRGFAGRVGFGRSPALLVVDFVVGFTDLTSPLAGDLDAPLGQTLRLLQSARRRNVPVFFTTVEYDASLIDAGLFPQKVAGLKWLIRGSRWVELDPRLGRQEGELVIKKKYASAFFGTELASTLTTLAVDTLIITGCTTSGCIRATVVDAMQYGLHAIVPREAVGDRAQAPHEASLFDIDSKYGDVVTVEEALGYLEALRSPRTEEHAAAEGR